jgi:glycosyltransferase involved in cell wall biosynthesis
MNILQIGTTDKKGGAAGISWTIKQYLDTQGIPNSMFVRDKYSGDATVFQIPNRFKKLSKLSKYILSNDVEYSNSDWILHTQEYKDADIIHCHNLHGYYFNLETLYKMSLEKKIVWTFHDMWPLTSHCAYTFESENTEKGLFVCPSTQIHPPILFPNDSYLINKKTSIYSKTNFHIVGPSQWMLNCINKTILKDKPQVLIYNGVGIEQFKKSHKEESRKYFNLPLDKKIILCIADGGKKNPFKGGKYIDEMIQRYKNKKDILFVSVGSNIKDRKQKDNVMYMPRINSKQELVQLYSSADVLLNPTLAETFGLVIVEAMLCGLPVITFKTGGVPEIIDDKINGYVVEYKNSEKLYSCLNNFFELDMVSREKMSQNAIMKAQKFDQDKMLLEYMNLYQNLLK